MGFGCERDNFIPDRLAIRIAYPVFLNQTKVVKMGRKKGDGKGRLGGRTKGTPNKVTGTVKEWIASIIDGNRQQFEEDLTKLDAGERVRTISNLLQYVTPKVQSVSPEELLEKEMQEIRELLLDFPENVIDRVAERVEELKNRKQK